MAIEKGKIFSIVINNFRSLEKYSGNEKNIFSLVIVKLIKNGNDHRFNKDIGHDQDDGSKNDKNKNEDKNYDNEKGL